MVSSTSAIYALTSNLRTSVIIPILCSSDLHTYCILNSLLLLAIEFHPHHQIYSGCSIKTLKLYFLIFLDKHCNSV